MVAFLTCMLSSLVTKGPRDLEKKVNETRVSKTVFGQLKETRNLVIVIWLKVKSSSRFEFYL